MILLQVVDAILRTARSDPALAALQLHGDPAQFTLLVAEDDGQVDHDFPEVSAAGCRPDFVCLGSVSPLVLPCRASC